MDLDIAKGGAGMGAWDAKFAGGKFVLEDTGLDISLSVGAKVVLEALKKAIPGKIDDTVIDVIESALGIK